MIRVSSSKPHYRAVARFGQPGSVWRSTGLLGSVPLTQTSPGAGGVASSELPTPGQKTDVDPPAKGAVGTHELKTGTKWAVDCPLHLCLRQALAGVSSLSFLLSET